jgi:mono/diheme cytochrome c family protein
LFASASLAPLAHAADGKAIYADHCEACHQPGGKGAAGLAPPLKSAILRQAASARPDYVPLVILNGISGHIESEGLTFQTVMPGLPHLADDDIAKVASYVYQGFNGVKAAKIEAKAVAALRATPKTAADLRSLRGGGS